MAKGLYITNDTYKEGVHELDDFVSWHEDGEIKSEPGFGIHHIPNMTKAEAENEQNKLIPVNSDFEKAPTLWFKVSNKSTGVFSESVSCKLETK